MRRTPPARPQTGVTVTVTYKDCRMWSKCAGIFWQCCAETIYRISSRHKNVATNMSNVPARPPTNTSDASARPAPSPYMQIGVTLAATDGRQRHLELLYVFQCSETITFHGH